MYTNVTELTAEDAVYNFTCMYTLLDSNANSYNSNPLKKDSDFLYEGTPSAP